ncbi:fimbrial protein [Paraburkholderia fungorum]|uniref:fimbrial protein n=1 Tax=Paraburkholderia fungorum TaxID=134537 RepID=UPI0038BBE9EA
MFKLKLVKQCFLHALVLVTLALGWAASARADCPVANLPMSFTYGTIAVSNSLAVGNVIPGTAQNFTLSGKCSASNLFNQPIVACPSTQTAVAGMTGVYTTGMAGVGMRMRNSSGTPLVGTGLCSSTTSLLGTTAADGSFSVSGTFELVKTGSIVAGTISSAASYNTGIYTRAALNNSSAASALSVANGTSVRPVTCSVTSATANQTIPMVPISPSALNAAGAVAARTPFSISLSCESGVKVAVTFTSASGNSGIGSVLASTGSATGVGVQLLDASWAPITLDAARQLSSGTTGNDSFQFYGQYYQLGAAQVTPGAVNASAIFTMSYQ